MGEFCLEQMGVAGGLLYLVVPMVVRSGGLALSDTDIVLTTYGRINSPVASTLINFAIVAPAKLKGGNA